MKLVFLSGGTGTPKLIQGFLQLVRQEEITVVGNTGEDLEVSGLYISPDLDTLLYTFAGIVNEDTWYGIRGDTFFEHERLKSQGFVEILRIGDGDRETKKLRTELMRKGFTLSEATRELCRRFGVRARLLPMSDSRVTTRILTREGEMSFHEFWVLRRGQVEVQGVRMEGAEAAEPAPGVLEALGGADLIIIGPSNPVTSIGPILSIRKIRRTLEGAREKVVAVSPIIGERPVSGPAGVLMRGLGFEVSPVGVAKMYSGLIGTLFVDRKDAGRAAEIRELGVSVQFADLLMPDYRARKKLASEILKFWSGRNPEEEEPKSQRPQPEEEGS
jgi:LPPG:FO 2-phospho-L-lactate transferase